MPPGDRPLDDVADAILDGTPIDWAEVEARVDERSRALLSRLRVLAALAEVHRGLPDVSAMPDEATANPPSALSEHAAPREHWGHLELLEPIGRGAFAQVYRARDTRLDRDVALKLIFAQRAAGETRAQSIIDEGRLLARVRHPNVVTIHGAERIGDQVGLWMELVEGRTLEQLLQQGRRFSVPEVVAIGIQLCDAISAVHGAGLLHRDVKSHNVMLSDDARVVLMDFGTGHEVDDPSAASLAGTPLYLAPELLAGQEPTVRTEIYSVGVLLYHLLTGSYPVRAHSFRELRLAHERGRRTSIRAGRPDLVPRLARIVERAIDAAPERRYAHVDALRMDLGAALKPRPLAVRLRYASGAAAAILAVVGIGWGTTARHRGWSATPLAPFASAARSNPVGAASTLTGPHIIAVLPLVNLGAAPDSDDFVDGLTDEIIRSLAVIDGLQVRSRTSSFAFKGKPRNLREVGERLGANLVIEGSVLRSGNRLRINAQLVQADGDVTLWAERFDRELDDIFAIQEDISRAIVNRLRLTLDAGQRRYDVSVDTYSLYLKARALVARRGADSAAAAAQLFQQVIAHEPAFAPAYAGLAEAYGFMSHATLSPGPVDAALPVMQRAAEKALALDPSQAEGHAAMGVVYARQYRWADAQTAFRRAVELNPALSQIYTTYWATTLIPLEELDEADRLLQVAMQADPLSAAVLDHLGFQRLLSGRYAEAVDHFERARALDPDLAFVDQHLGRALTFAGRFSEALSFWEAKNWHRSPGGTNWMAAAYVMAGRRAEVEQMAEAEPEPYRLALFRAALGDRDRTFQALNRAAEIVPHRVVPLLAYPEMRLLRGDPRLADLRRRLRLP